MLEVDLSSPHPNYVYQLLWSIFGVFSYISTILFRTVKSVLSFFSFKSVLQTFRNWDKCCKKRVPRLDSLNSPYWTIICQLQRYLTRSRGEYLLLIWHGFLHKLLSSRRVFDEYRSPVELFAEVSCVACLFHQLPSLTFNFPFKLFSCLFLFLISLLHSFSFLLPSTRKYQHVFNLNAAQTFFPSPFYFYLTFSN